MSYDIIAVDILQPEIELRVRTLLKNAYGHDSLLPKGYLYKYLYSKKVSKESFFLVAVEQGEFIGCSGFMSTDFMYNTSLYSCYQGCWAATDPKHQGRKIFFNIFKKAIELLKEQEAGFIYEVAGDNTHPIFVKKLGFVEVPAIMIKIPNIPYLNRFWFNKKFSPDTQYYKRSVFLPVESQIVELKQNIDPENTHIIQVNKSFLWGRVLKKRKAGITVKYFYVGGVDIHEISDYHLLIKKVLKEHSVAYIQIVSSATNRYNELLKGWKPAGINPFVFFNLSPVPVKDINLMYGAIDVF